MPWYSAGTIQVAANGTTATGTGTAFLANVRVGDGITIAGSAAQHEIIGVASDTSLSFRPAYAGPAGAGKGYSVAPLLGYDKDLSDAFNAIRLELGDFANNPTLRSLAALQGSAGQALRLKSPGEIEAFMLGTASGLSADSVLQVGQPLLGKGQIECLTYEATTTVSDVLISTNIPVSEGVMPHLTIKGAVHGYTAPFEIQLSWYFYQGAFYLPKAVILGHDMTASGTNIRIFLSHADGKVKIRLDFAGSVYIARLGIVAFKGPAYGGDLSYYRQWSAQYSAGSQSGEVVVASSFLLTNKFCERGSNSNGHYTKFGDGTLIVNARKLLEVTSPNSDTSSYYTFPHAFANADYSLSLTVSAVNMSHGYTVAKLAGNGRTPTEFEVRLNASATQNYTIDVIAKGWWF